MSTELATQDYSQEKVNLIKQLVAKDCTDLELELFLYTCRKTGLDPLARQIYAIKRGGKMSIQTGIDGYRVIADRTGLLAGISDPIHTEPEGGKYPLTATVTVRKVIPNGIADFTATARWGEYNAGGPMWQKMPFLMLGKCAEALALRKAFPADLSGVYTAEEMAQAGPDDSEQRDAVFAEVERQKTATNTKLVDVVTPAKTLYQQVIESVDKEIHHPSIPPELDWEDLKPSGVLIARVMDAKLGKKKDGGEFVVLTLNRAIQGKTNLLYYWHATHRQELLAAKGKVVKLEVVAKAKGYTLEHVLEIDGVRMAISTNDELNARMLASTLDYDEESLREVHGSICGGDWAKVVAHLEGVKARREAGDAV
jgi:phage recombination protein Bet